MILLLSGSTREGSTNTAALRTVAELAVVPTRLYDGLAALPHFNPDDVPDLAVEALRAAVHEADAVLICTPEYAGALPGSFKNLLEHLVGDASPRSIAGKPVAWINVANLSAPTGAADAHASLRIVLGYIGAVVVEPACVRVPLTRRDVGEDGLVVPPGPRAELIAAFEELVAAGRDVSG